MHPVIRHVHDQAEMTRWLKMPAHDAERHSHLAADAQHRGNNCMKRPLAARSFIRMSLLQVKARSPALKIDAEFRRSKARTEAVED